MVLISAMIAHPDSKQPLSPIRSERIVLEGAAFSGSALGAFFDRRFGKDLLSMVVVPAARGSGCLMYNGQCHGWRGSVFRDDRATTRTRPPVA